MNKIVLKENIVLDDKSHAPGTSGILIIQQDEAGYHQIALNSPVNIGDIKIAYQPGSITELKWAKDDAHVYWSSTIMTHEIELNPPSKITDLTVVLVDNIGVKIRWTAPQRNPPTDTALNAVDLYHVKVTESAIDTSTAVGNIRGIADYKTDIVPKLPGQQEELVVSGLRPGRKYYICVMASATVYGTTRIAEPSNIVTPQTAFIDSANTATPQRIPLDPDFIFDNMVSAEYNNKEKNHHPLEAQTLADYTNVIDNNGVPVGLPVNMKGIDTNLYGFLHTDWFNMPAVYSIIDLQQFYNLAACYIISNAAPDGSDGGGMMVDFQTSSDGVNYNTVASREESYSVNGNNWYKIEMDPAFTQNVRYFRIAWKRGEGRISGLTLYGNLAAKYIISGKKYKRNVVSRTFDKMMGINCFLAEGHLERIAPVASILRLFNDGNWLMSRRFESAGSGLDSTPDTITMQLETSRMWNFDEKLKVVHDNSMEALMCITNEPPHMRDPVVTPAPMEAKPIDPRLNNRDINVTTNPQSYKQYARIAYNLAARYGFNKNADTRFIQLDGDSPKRGLGYVEYYTFGNERDANWADADRFNSAHEIAARMSACYDGHKGELGEGFGIKAADPDSKMTSSAIYYVKNLGYTHDILKWCDLNRGEGDYPFEVIDIHLYNTYEEQVNTPMYSNIPKNAAPPEEEEYWHMLPKWAAFRDRFAPNKEIWITELGYDEQKGGTNAFPYPSQFERSRYKAYCLLRSFLLMPYMGIDRITMYWWANTTTRLEEVNANGNTRDTFLTSGITDGVSAYNDWDERKPLMSYWYLAELKQDMTGYSYSHAVVIYGEHQTTTNIVNTIHTKLFALAFKKEDTGETALVLWLVGVEMDKVNIELKVSNTETNVPVVYWDEAELRAPDVGGRTGNIAAVANAGSKYITVAVGECPVMVKTKNIGIGKLIPPADFQTQAVSTDAIKLAWTDKNIGTNNVRVYRSDRSDYGFEIIYSGYVDNGEYTVYGLAENTPYYFRIQFADGERISDVSEVRGNTTQLTIPIPANLRASAVTTSTITLAWDYTTQQQALVDNFEIYRSATVNGTYNKVMTVPATFRSFKDVGLVDGTTYYYKIRAKKDFTYSDFTLGFAVTTALPNAQSPVPTAGVITYTGDEIIIRFDKNVKDVSGNQSAFSVVSNPQTAPELINVTSTFLDNNDSGLIHLKLSKVLAGSEAVSVSYNWQLGSMKSTFDNGAVASFTDYFVVNHANDSALLSQRVKLNFRGTQQGAQGTSPAAAYWNDITIPAKTTVHQFQGTLKNDKGNASGYRWLLPNSGWPSYYGNWDKDDFISWDSTNPTGNDAAINNTFPDYTRNNGVSFYTNEPMCLLLSGLDATKEYTVKAFASCDNELDANGQQIIATLATVSIGTPFTWRVGRGQYKVGALSGLKAGATQLQGIGNDAFEYSPTTGVDAVATTVLQLANNIAFTVTHAGAVKMLLAAAIIEELIPINI